MAKSVSEMPQSLSAAGLRPAEAERNGIHLVTLPKALPVTAAVASRLVRPRLTSRRNHTVRESEKMITLALAGAALIAPVIWMGHALLVWMDIL